MVRARLLALALCAAAHLSPSAAAAQDDRAVLELVVNGVAKGEVFVILREGDVLVPLEKLSAAGLRDFTGTRLTIDGETLVGLASLAPGFTFRVDERDLTLAITADPSFLAERVRTFGSAAPPDLVYRSDTSGFVNYALNWNQSGGTDLFTESAGRFRNALVYNTLSIDDRGTTTRGLTSVTVDDRRRMSRWVVGDAFAQTGPLGGAAWTGGITLTREFGIEPYFMRHPSLSISTPIATPSTVEVEVNGRIVSQEQVAPGQLDMRDLPVTVGRNDARVIVRDAFGATREISASYYLASSVLAPGLHDYQYSLGFRRDALGTSSWDYKEPVALARHRVGLTDALTAGGRFEASRDLFNIGPSINVRLPFGEIEGAAALSGGREGAGRAVLGAFSYSGRPAGFGGSLMAASDSYATVDPRPREERVAIEASVYGSITVSSRVGLTAQHTEAELQSGVARSRSSVLATVHLARNVQLTASAARVRDENGAGREAFVGLSVLFGKATASLSVARSRDGVSTGVDVRQSLPVGEGFGYQARLETGTPGSFAGVAQYQGRYGRYELRRDVVGDNGATSAIVSGALVGIGGGLFATRPVQQSFALVRVPGVEGVRGFASNQEVGRTNADGNLLVPDLQPYYGNLLNIADSDIPLDYSVDGVRLTLAVPYRGGALALFPVQLIRRVTGSVRIGTAGADRVPNYGELRVTPEGASAIVSPLGEAGDFYFENLPAGRHAATVVDDEGECTFTIDIPDTAQPLIDAGALRCLP